VFYPFFYFSPGIPARRRKEKKSIIVPYFQQMFPFFFTQEPLDINHQRLMAQDKGIVAMVRTRKGLIAGDQRAVVGYHMLRSLRRREERVLEGQVYEDVEGDKGEEVAYHVV
jgi:hypothetical protein